MNEMKSKVLRYGVGFLLIALLCWLFPYTGDDWAWGSKIGLERLHLWFDNYNGRYAGNLIVLAMTRSNLLKTVIMSFCLIGIAFCAECIFKKKWVYYASLVMLVLMPKLILRQAVVWTAGFSNYVTSLFLTLIYIVYIYPVFKMDKDKASVRFRLWHSLPLLILGIVNTLIVEHLTIYNVILAAGVILYTAVAYRKVFVSHIAYLLGSVAGAIYMFSNSAYHSIANNQDGYRQMAEGGVILRALRNYVNEIAKHLCLNNVWVNLAILIVCWLLYRQTKADMTEKRELFLAKLSMCVITFYNVWALLSSFGIATWTKQKYLLHSEAILTVLYMIALISLTVLVAARSNRLWEILFWNAAIVCIAAPLLVVNPIGERCFFATYIMFFMLFLELACTIKRDNVVQLLEGKAFSSTCVIISLAGLCFYLNIFTSAYQTDRARLARIEKQVAKGKTSVEILHLPYESYLWTSTPEREPWIERYKLFYGLPENLELKAVWEYKTKKK